MAAPSSQEAWTAERDSVGSCVSPPGVASAADDSEPSIVPIPPQREVNLALDLAEEWWRERLAMVRDNIFETLETMQGDLLDEFQKQFAPTWPDHAFALRTSQVPTPPLTKPTDPHPAAAIRAARHETEDQRTRVQLAIRAMDEPLPEEMASAAKKKAAGVNRSSTMPARVVVPETCEPAGHAYEGGESDEGEAGLTSVVPSGRRTSIEAVLERFNTETLRFSSIGNSISNVSISTVERLVSFGVLHRIERIIKGQGFEVFFAVAIMLNAVVLSFQLQYTGLNLGHEVGYRTYTRRAEDIWPGAGNLLDTLDKVFIVLFTAEMFARMAAYRKKWFYTMWSYLDAVVVGMAVTMWATEAAPGAGLDWNPMIVRLVRFGKLMRVVRIVRSNFFLYSLKLLVASIQASCETLFWSLCVLILIQSIAGMLVAQAVEYYISDPSQPIETRREVFGYFGTFWRSIVTMFEIIFANWAPSCRLLLDHVSEYFGIFFLIYRCAIGFAVLSVIQAVFIQQTMKSAQLDDDYILQDKQREQSKYVKRLMRVFEMLDESGDGFISWSEFEAIWMSTHMQTMLASMEVDYSDLEVLFRMLDSGNGLISSSEFINGLQSMKGGAKALDVIKIWNTVKRLEGKMDVLTKNLNLRRTVAT